MERPIKRLWDEKYNFGRAVDEYNNWGGGSYFQPIGIIHDLFYYSRLIINEADIGKPNCFAHLPLTSLYKQPYVKIKFAYIDLKKPNAIIEFSELSVETSEIGWFGNKAMISPDGDFLYFPACSFLSRNFRMRIYKLDMKTLKWSHYIKEIKELNYGIPAEQMRQCQLYCNENGIFIRYNKEIELPFNNRTKWVHEYAFVTLDDQNQRINMEKISIPMPTLPMDDIQPNEENYRQLYSSLSYTSPFPLKIDNDPFRCEIIAIGRSWASESFYSKLIVFKNGSWNLYKCESSDVYEEKLGRAWASENVSYCCSINNRIILKLHCASWAGQKGNFYEIVLNDNEKSWKIIRKYISPIRHHATFNSRGDNLCLCIGNGVEVRMTGEGFEIYRNEPHALAQIGCKKLRSLMGYKEEGFIWYSDDEIKKLIKQVNSYY